MRTPILNRYSRGWICLRVYKTGRASRKLLRAGFFSLDHASRNNRNGFDYVIPCRTREQFEAFDWEPFRASGLIALGFWITDAQWGQSAPLTHRQWCSRKAIGDTLP